VVKSDRISVTEAARVEERLGGMSSGTRRTMLKRAPWRRT
jgi:hypothetical protein